MNEPARAGARAMAAVLMPRTAAAPTVAPITASRDSFIEGASFAPPKVIAPMRKISRRSWDEGTVKLRRLHVNVLFQARSRGTCRGWPDIKVRTILETFRFADPGGLPFRAVSSRRPGESVSDRLVRQFVTDSGAVTRGLRQGRAYTLTLNGEPLARMIRTSARICATRMR